MTLKQPDQEAIAHGRISEKPLRDKPSIPSWVLKLTMAVTGLLFTLFVIGHMAGNLKLYAPATEDGAALDVYGRFLRSAGEPLLPENALLWIVRIVLLAALVAHILAAIMLYQRSGQSRGKFKRTNLMGGMDSFATRSMLVTGIVLLCFIVFHLLDLTMGVQPVASDPSWKARCATT